MLRFETASALALMLATAVMPSPAWADNSSPVGLWKNIDDATGKPRALIRISETAGTLQGTVVKVFPGPTEDQSPKCTKCEGARKNAPIVGIVMITGMRRDGDEYSGGEILDPENRKVYSSNMHLLDGGKKLSVRGYIGVSLLGRSQTWIRQE